MAKPLSGSTAPSLGTRSRTWPYEARTVKSLPRYLLIVLALAGDSTMRRFLAMGEVGGKGGAERPTPGPGATGAWVGSFFSGVTPPQGVSSRTATGAGGACRFWDPRREPSVHRLGLVQEHLGLHPGVGRLGPRLVEQDHQDHPFQVVQVQLVLVQGDGAVEHQLALVRVQDPVLFEEQQEAAAFDIELFKLGAVEDAGGAVRAAGRGGFGTLLCERVEPIEGLEDFRGTKTGFREFGKERAVLESVAVANRWNGVVGEVVLEQVQQDVQDALFHFPRPASRATLWRFRMTCGYIGRVSTPHVLQAP